jgi:hypothetical protein
MNSHIDNSGGWRVHSLAEMKVDEAGWSRGNPFAMTLAKAASELARGRDVLFHGTRYWRQIARSGLLKYAPVGPPVVSLTRSAAIAGDMATLPRDDDEGGGAILVFDRPSLKSRYRLERHADGWSSDGRVVEEFEERVWYRDVKIALSLTHVVVGPRSPVSDEVPNGTAAGGGNTAIAMVATDTGEQANRQSPHARPA